MGLGVGAIFPLTATKAAEDAGTEKIEANRITQVTNSDTEEKPEKKLNLLAASWSYFWQMPGILAPWVMTLFLNLNSKSTPSQNWRAVLGFGSIPYGICTILLIIEYIATDTI